MDAAAQNNARYEDFYLLKNSLTPAEVNQLLNIKQALEANPESVAKRASDAFNRHNYIYRLKDFMPEYQVLKELVISRLPFRKEDYELEVMNFFTIQKPYSLHCDNLGTNEGFYQVIIPLEVKPLLPTYTILFDQTSPYNTEWIAPSYNKDPDYKPFHNTPIYDPKFYPGWSDQYKITEEDGLQYWGDTWEETFREAYKGFSIKHCYQWSIGDLFIFNSQFNHCSSELMSLGVDSKTGLLACLKRI
jgi:hypothetical protein